MELGLKAVVDERFQILWSDKVINIHFFLAFVLSAALVFPTWGATFFSSFDVLVLGAGLFFDDSCLALAFPPLAATFAGF